MDQKTLFNIVQNKYTTGLIVQDIHIHTYMHTHTCTHTPAETGIV